MEISFLVVPNDLEALVPLTLRPLTNTNPEGQVFIDLNHFIDHANTLTGLAYGTSSETIEGITATINSVSYVGATPTKDVKGDLRARLYYEIENGIDVSSNIITNLVNDASPSPTTKVVNFSWTDSCKAPNYEFQLLRLFNTDETTIVNEHQIKTKVNWNKALSFQTESATPSIALTIGEGQGYYVWRVRPIGTFYKGDIANDKNWGNWNDSAYLPNTMIDFTSGYDGGECFFFVDLEVQY